MTEYIILRLEESADTAGVWNEWGKAQASSPQRALRTFADVEPGTYVATPLRSWNPLTVKVEQTTKVTIS